MLPAIPADWKGWCIYFVCTVIFDGSFYPRKSPLSAWSSLLLLSALSVFAMLGLLTGIGFIPDDWSATRLTWSAGLLRGYSLYPRENGPFRLFPYSRGSKVLPSRSHSSTFLEGTLSRAINRLVLKHGMRSCPPVFSHLFIQRIVNEWAHPHGTLTFLSRHGSVTPQVCGHHDSCRCTIFPIYRPCTTIV